MKMWKLAGIRIAKKLALVFGGSVLLVVCLTGVSVWALCAIHTAMAESQTKGHLMTLSQKISSDLGGIAQRVASMLLSSHRNVQLETELLALRKDYMIAFGELKSSASTEDCKRLLGQAEQAATRWREADNQALALLKAGKRLEATALHDVEIVPRFHEVVDAINRYGEYRLQELAKINEQAEALTSRSIFLLIALGLVLLVSSVIFGILITRSITVPLSKTMLYLESVAKGDLTQDVAPEHLARQDEIGLLAKAVESMANSLRDVIRNITGGIGVLSSS